MRWKTSVASTLTMQTAFVPDMALLKPTKAVEYVRVMVRPFIGETISQAHNKLKK